MSARRDRSDPLRRCLSCRQLAPKSQLLRVVRLPDDEIRVASEADGRGAYIHDHQDCLRIASSTAKPLSRALRRQIPPDLLTALSQLATTPTSRLARSETL